ncbi:MAG: hypothetical protein A2770_03955 [Candidatus Levybacteria bacterium RIFCSPHIGHO2_01_FULL_38_12]|nr:MAG: hypothetical protein A2770_03955 [Candidatus Levybacteria bacterium RIFCSPHIGHO2_01_FULL_38_12]OGH44980.1 MAG: hypothetical protein A3J14_01335 [Candidatus Levybacteria bacterium RIFCSPLOWO2_02_FULL_37_18]
MNVFKRITWNWTLVVILLLIAAIPFVVFYSQKQQEVRQRATGEDVSFFFTLPTSTAPIAQLNIDPNQQGSVKLYLNTLNKNINSFDITIQFPAGVTIDRLEAGTGVVNNFDDPIFNDVDPQANSVRFSKINTNTTRIIRGAALHVATLFFTAGQNPSGNITILDNATITTPTNTQTTLTSARPPLAIAVPLTNTPVPSNTPTPTPTPSPTPTPTDIPHSTCNANMLQNPGFEVGGSPAGSWNVAVAGEAAYLTRVTNKSHTGIASIKGNGQATSSLAISQIIPVRSNTNYAVSAFMWASDWGPFIAVLRATPSGDGYVVGPIDGGARNIWELESNFNGWSQVNGTFTTDARTHFVQFALFIGTGQQDVWIDDAGLSEINPACPTPTPGAFNVRLALSLTLPHAQSANKTARVKMYDAQNQEYAAGGQLTKQASGVYTGTVDMGALAEGTYTIKVKAEKFLQKLVGKDNNRIAQNIVAGQTYTVPPTTLVPGDANNDNIINIQDYNTIMSCLQTSSSSCNRSTADLDDNGTVGPEDLQIFYEGARATVGD